MASAAAAAPPPKKKNEFGWRKSGAGYLPTHSSTHPRHAPLPSFPFFLVRRRPAGQPVPPFSSFFVHLECKAKGGEGRALKKDTPTVPAASSFSIFLFPFFAASPPCLPRPSPTVFQEKWAEGRARCVGSWEGERKKHHCPKCGGGREAKGLREGGE